MSALRTHTSTPAAVPEVREAIQQWRAGTEGVLVVAVDGRGASGKTTITRAVAAQTGAALIHTDDFFRTAARSRRPRIEDYYDWAALRAEALQPLRSGRPARFLSRSSERPGADRTVTIHPAALVLIEGVTASCDALADLVDRTILVRISDAERLDRLHRFVSDEDWDEQWLDAEGRYLLGKPETAFDLVVSGACPDWKV